jgi:prepilin-type processing-associated H-X9-DG protein
MRFSLQTLLLSFVLVWSALAALGGCGIAVAAILLAIVAYLRTAESMIEAFKRVAVFFLILLALTCLLLPSVSRAREAARRLQCANHLKNIAIALHNYHDMHGTFPPAYIPDAQGKPMHSWRVLILPFIEEQPLYDQYDFSEPWNGPNNKKLAGAAMAPSVYQCLSDPDVAGSAMTSYVAVVGPTTAWPDDKCRKLDDFGKTTDGTILVTEMANSGIHWMEPRDVALENAVRGVNRDGPKGISSRHFLLGGYFFQNELGVNMAMADGSVEFVPERISPSSLETLLTVSDKQTIDFDALPPKRPHWSHIIGLATLVVSFLLLLLRPRRREPAVAKQSLDSQA